MKKIGITFVSLLAALPLLAASNCVSRVDKNLNKTTTEKINYCLEEDQTPEVEQNKTEVVWSDTYSVQYPAPKTKNKQAPVSKDQRKNVSNYEPYNPPVSMEYIDRKDYPAFRNDTMPALSPEEAHETAMEALQPKKPVATKKNNKKQKPAVKVNKPAKPARKMSDQEIAAALETAPIQATPSAQPTPAQTAMRDEQIQQAQALQNDPLATNPTDNGAVSNEFLDDSVMGPSDFGYNATDPAMQQ